MTTEQAKVKPGDAVTVGVARIPVVVRSVYPDGIAATDEQTPDGTLGWKLYFYRWQSVNLPEPPKAKPGVIYRHCDASKAVGLADGRLWDTSNSKIIRFSGVVWSEFHDWDGKVTP